MATPFFGSAAPTASPAGLSSLKPFAIDHFRTAPIRPRTFFAVTGLVDQIGNRMLITSAEVMSLTRRVPILGIAWSRSDARHCLAVLPPFFHPGVCISMTWSAASAKVGTIESGARCGVVAGASDLAVLGCGFACFGKSDQRIGANAQVAALALNHNALYPAPGAAGFDEEEQAVEVVVLAWLGVADAGVCQAASFALIEGSSGHRIPPTFRPTLSARLEHAA